ncbi:MAG: class I SAM-dependent methyltransferase [Candidatus Vogelbacteria bacterium]|nr:class I SAM-dependent methyltransferase [Candidatus Vogelbacteria bacterium]
MFGVLEKWFEKIEKDGLKQYLDSVQFKGGDVLDVGCGSGMVSELFDNGYIGIDKELSEVESAKKKYPNSRFETMDATKINFPDSSFDLSFSVAVFHHLSDDECARVLHEMFRVTKEHGHVLIVDLVLPGQMKFLAYPVFWLDKGAHIRDFEKLAVILSSKKSELRFSNLSRFVNLGGAVFEWEKNLKE